MVFGGEQSSCCWEVFEFAQGEVAMVPDVATNERLKKMA
jgi:hypothetical protein